MKEKERLALGIILGGVMWVGGTYLLLIIFGESRLISVLVGLGWFTLAAYTVKYLGLIKKDK